MLAVPASVDRPEYVGKATADEGKGSDVYDAEGVEKIRAAQQKTIDATGKKMMTIDPKGGNSNVVTDYDVMLDALSNSYPDALAESFGGDKKPLEEVSAELDKRTKKVESWHATSTRKASLVRNGFTSLP